MNLKNLTATQAGEMIRDKKISCVELAQYSLKQIEENEKNINAFTNVYKESALNTAKQTQDKINSGEYTSILAGVPMGIKDNICTKDINTTCASKMLENFVPPYNATVTDKLNDIGAVMIGKLNMDEFAMGGSCETSYFNPTHNPWDVSKVAGGSSGGAAAAVSCGEVFYSLGSDTGGSIRQPAAFCGVSGIKPTYGSVSRYGLIAYASSLDQIGPIGKDIRDCAEVLQIIGGKDNKDSTSVQRADWDFTEALKGDIQGLKIGIPKEYFADGLDEEVKTNVMIAAKKLEALGAKLIDIKMPLVKYSVPAYYIIACAEASSNLSRYDGIKYGFRDNAAKDLSDVYISSRSKGFGIEVKRRIFLGTFVLSSGYFDAYYKKALKVRELIRDNFTNAFNDCDVILSPVTPTAAYKIGENIADPIKMYLGDIYTASVNLAGLPGASIPCGVDKDNMPIGLQLIGRPFDENTLIRCGSAYQMNTDFHNTIPTGGVK